MSRLRTLWPLLALALLTLIPFWRCVLLGENIGAWDEVRQMAPWNDHAHATPWDVLQADSVLEFYGWRDQVFHAWGSNHLPLWNSYELGGTPLLANSQSGGFYPPHILVGVLQIPTSPALALLAWFHVFWAGLGVYVLCRRLGGAQIVAFLGAAGFSLSAFMIGWAALPSVIETVSWIPWILLGVYKLPKRSGVLILAGSIAMCLLAGHLQFAAYGLIGGAVAFFVRLFQTRTQWRPMFLAGLVGMAAGGLLACPQLLPVLEYGKHSHRRNAPTAEGYDSYNAGALPVWQLLSIPDAQLLGLPTTEMTVDDAKVNGFWPALIQRGGNFAESAIGMGPLVLWMLFAGFRRRTLALGAGIGAAGIVGLLLALGTFLGALLYYGVPGWSATGSPGRAAVLFVLAACILAGTWNPEVDLVSARQLRDRTLLFGVFVVVCAGVIFRLPLAPWVSGLTAEELHADIPHAVLAARALGGAALMIVLGVIFVRSLRASPYAAGAAALFLALVPGLSLVRSSPSRLPGMDAPPDRMAFVNGPWDLLQSTSGIMPSNTAGLLGLHELGGYDSIIDVRTRDLLAEIDGRDPAPAANGNMMFVKWNFDPAKLADAGVSDVWSLVSLPQFGAVALPRDGIYRYHLPGRGRAYTATGPATIHETAQSIDVEASGPGFLTLKDNLREGWSASVDDMTEPFIADPWPQVHLPAGRHTVRFRYWPPGLTLGIRAMALGLVIIALYIAGLRWFASRNANTVVQ